MNKVIHFINNEVKCPECVTDEHLVFLDKLRASGVTNMLGAVPYLLRDFPNLWIARAKDILFYWMETFPRNEANE